MATFAERIKDYRLSAGLSQRALAEKFGVKQQAIGHWEGGRSLPGPKHLPMVAKALGVTVPELFAVDPRDGLVERVADIDNRLIDLTERVDVLAARLG